MSGLKRMTPQQSRKANALIKKTCCNCMGGNCILLDDGDECVCPQLISYSLLCAGKPPSGCGNDAPALRSRREKALMPCRFSDAI